MSKHGQDYNEQFTSKEMFEQGRQYEREETQRLNKKLNMKKYINLIVGVLVYLFFLLQV
jgi:hypothetical protein